MDVFEICSWLKDIAEGCSSSWGNGASVVCPIARVSKKSSEVLRMVTEWMKTDRDGQDDVVTKRLLIAEHPFTKLLIQSAMGQVTTHGDGGWLSLSVSTNFIIRFPTITPALIPHAITLCGRWVDEFFSTMNYSIDTSSSRHLLTIASNMFGSSAQMLGLSQREIAWLSSLYVQQFLSAINEETEMLSPSLMRYKYLPTADTTLLESTLVPHAIIDWDVPLEYRLVTGRKSLEKYKNKEVQIALFNFCMEPDTADESETIASEGSPDGVNELTNLMKLLETLVKQGVGVVASQKTIHRSARYYLAKNDVLALERLSIHHIDVVRIISKATIITTQSSELSPSLFGTITDLRVLTMSDSSSKVSIALSGPTPLKTLVVKHSNAHLYKELELLFKHLTKSMISHMADPRVGPGAGVTEFLLSEYLINKCTHMQSATTEPGVSNLAPFMRSEVEKVIRVFASVMRNIASNRSKGMNLANCGDQFNSNNHRASLAFSMGVDPMDRVGRKLFGPRAPPGTVFREGRSVVPSANDMNNTRTEVGGELPTLPNRCKYHSLRYPNDTLSVVAAFDDDGLLDTSDDNDFILPVVDSISAKRAAITSALDVSAMIIRTDALVIDTN
eukprot:TRINITY_DN22615_c0_g1_i1.p1 TRINITY_DN22615_c0_g1~~TRINITY_DN22615_c0_g1_i1.p1  ORF type:complete len:616 (+),score=82.50 TRINITY_DN22615_c0_g1_i1:52-1899(+)